MARFLEVEDAILTDDSAVEIEVDELRDCTNELRDAYEREVEAAKSPEYEYCPVLGVDAEVTGNDAIAKAYSLMAFHFRKTPSLVQMKKFGTVRLEAKQHDTPLHPEGTRAWAEQKAVKAAGNNELACTVLRFILMVGLLTHFDGLELEIGYGYLVHDSGDLEEGGKTRVVHVVNRRKIAMVNNLIMEVVKRKMTTEFAAKMLAYTMCEGCEELTGILKQKCICPNCCDGADGKWKPCLRYEDFKKYTYKRPVFVQGKVTPFVDYWDITFRYTLRQYPPVVYYHHHMPTETYGREPSRMVANYKIYTHKDTHNETEWYTRAVSWLYNTRRLEVSDLLNPACGVYKNDLPEGTPDFAKAWDNLFVGTAHFDMYKEIFKQFNQQGHPKWDRGMEALLINYLEGATAWGFYDRYGSTKAEVPRVKKMPQEMKYRVLNVIRKDLDSRWRVTCFCPKAAEEATKSWLVDYVLAGDQLRQIEHDIKRGKYMYKAPEQVAPIMACRDALKMKVDDLKLRMWNHCNSSVEREKKADVAQIEGMEAEKEKLVKRVAKMTELLKRPMPMTRKRQLNMIANRLIHTINSVTKEAREEEERIADLKEKMEDKLRVKRTTEMATIPIPAPIDEPTVPTPAVPEPPVAPVPPPVVPETPAAASVKMPDVMWMNGAEPRLQQALRVKRTSHHGILPERATAQAAGYDLFAAEDGIVRANGKWAVPTDIKIIVPVGTYGRIAPRSGLAVKHHLDVGAGVIDRDYRGEIKVVLFNHSKADYYVRTGDRIAQLILEKIVTPEVVEHMSVGELTTTFDKEPKGLFYFPDGPSSEERGNNGFGSTGR
jgi:dUTP pyrophosphatase